MGEQIVATLVSTLASAAVFVRTVLISTFAGSLLFRVHLLTDEPAAWLGLSFGFPTGGVFALMALFYCFKKIKNYGS